MPQVMKLDSLPLAAPTESLSLRSLRFVLRLNLDLLFSVGTVIVGLLAGAFLGMAIVHP